MIRDTRPISWLKAAWKDFEAFPDGARLEIERALTLAAEGRKADFAKPMQGLGSGVFEVALRYRRRGIPRCVCCATRRRYLGHPCFPEEIENRYQNATDGS